jgi:hypothetical protein
MILILEFDDRNGCDENVHMLTQPNFLVLKKISRDAGVLDGRAEGFRHYGFLGGRVSGLFFRGIFCWSWRAGGQPQRVINPGMAFFRLGGMLEVGAKHIIPAFVICRFHSKGHFPCVSGCVDLLDTKLMRRADQFNRPYFSATHELVRSLV